MKRLLLVATILIVCIVCLGSCKFFKKDTPCEHTYVDRIVAPTCKEEGYTEYTCTECGNSYRDIYTQKVTHPYRDTVVNPTCTAEGYTEHTCTVCGDTYRDGITQTVSHSYRATVINPTCTTEGYTEHTCTVCGDKYTDSTTQKVAHIYKSVVVSPTCTEEGYTNHICEICEVSYQDTVTKKVPHTYKAEIFVPDCTKEGYTLHTCSECGDNYTDNITEKTAHRFNGAPCMYCAKEEITVGFDANTDWYNAGLVSVTLTTAEELAGLAHLVNSGTSFNGMTIYLGADIDLGYREWTPIGNAEYAFDGTFDGEGYEIKGLKINANYSYVGLFGKATGKISDFTINTSSIYVTEIQQYVSIACGYSSNEVSNVTANGFIDATHSNYVGAVAGYLTVGISNCSANAYIFGGSYVGGIAGCSNVSSAVYSNLTYNGTVSGSEYTGGIVGNITATGSIQTNSLSCTGSVIGTKRVGGIVGYIAGAVGSQLYAASVAASITGECYVGGIAGEAVYVAISACSNEGSTVSATLYETVDSTMYAYLGGYVGKGYSVDGAINTSDIKYNLRGMYVGGIAGYLSHSASNCENDADISGYDYVGGIAGYVTTSTNGTIYSNLTNNGNISGTTVIGGIFGYLASDAKGYTEYKKISQVRNTYYYIYYHYFYGEVTLNNIVNNGTVNAIEKYAGGILGYIYTNNTSSKTAIHKGCGNSTYYYCDGYYDTRFYATDIKNSGDVSASGGVGELFGYIYSDCTVSAVSNYEILGYVTVDGTINEGDYSVGEKTNLTLSDRVYPEVEEEIETDNTENE